MRTRTVAMLILWFVILIIALSGLFYLTFLTDSSWYVRVDNARATDIMPRGGMYYRYELPARNERGQERTLTFETGRLLREGAWLRLHVAPIRGVTAWEEIPPEALPWAVPAE